MPESIYSDAALAPRRDPAARAQGFHFLEYLRSEPIGTWTDDRWRQAQHFRSVPYIAIECVMALVRGSTSELFRRRRRDARRTTFGPGGATSKAVTPGLDRGRDDEYTPFHDEDFPLSRLLSRPNPTETFGEFAAKVVLQNKLTGVGPVWAVPNARGRPVELWSLKTALLYPLYQRSLENPNGAWRVQPYAAGGWTTGFPAGMTGAGATLPGEEVKRFLSPHPFLDWDGFSSLSAGARELDVLDAIEESRKAAMDHGLQLDAVLIVPGLAEEESRAIQKKMTDRQGGARNARRFGVVSPPSGMQDKFDLKTFGTTPRDMDYPNGWEQAVKFVLALFGVPASVAGLADDPSYATHYAARQQFHARQEDFLHCLASFFTKSLCWPWCSFPDEYLVRITPRPIDDKDLAEKKHARQLQNQTITLNESRAKDDLPPLDGGDVPAELYWQQKQQELMPQPASPGVPGAAPGQSQPGAEPDPLDALFAGAGKGPTAGAAPEPANPAGEGSLPPRVGKADGMCEGVGSAGGFLVRPRVAAKKRRKVVRRVLAKALARLEGS